jgi:hypothetical protein
MDEHRVGLQPILRRVWAPRGHRPVAPVQPRYEWTYLYGFVRPTTGQTYWLLLPTVSGAAFAAALREFAQAVGAGGGKRVVLVLDGAGWHRGQEVRVPDGIQLAFLPPYAPELQPAERLWPLTNEPVANRHFPDLAALQQVQAERCLALRAQPDVIRAHTHFHWWSEAA